MMAIVVCNSYSRKSLINHCVITDNHLVSPFSVHKTISTLAAHTTIYGTHEYELVFGDTILTNEIKPV